MFFLHHLLEGLFFHFLFYQRRSCSGLYCQLSPYFPHLILLHFEWCLDRWLASPLIGLHWPVVQVCIFVPHSWSCDLRHCIQVSFCHDEFIQCHLSTHSEHFHVDHLCLYRHYVKPCLHVYELCCCSCVHYRSFLHFLLSAPCILLLLLHEPSRRLELEAHVSLLVCWYSCSDPFNGLCWPHVSEGSYLCCSKFLLYLSARCSHDFSHRVGEPNSYRECRLPSIHLQPVHYSLCYVRT